VLDGVLQSVKIWLKFSKYQKNMGLTAMGRGNGGRDGGGDGAGLSKSSKKTRNLVGKDRGVRRVAGCGFDMDRR
jgi:hypothetical protein